MFQSPQGQNPGAGQFGVLGLGNQPTVTVASPLTGPAGAPSREILEEVVKRLADGREFRFVYSVETLQDLYAWKTRKLVEAPALNGCPCWPLGPGDIFCCSACQIVVCGRHCGCCEQCSRIYCGGCMRVIVLEGVIPALLCKQCIKEIRGNWLWRLVCTIRQWLVEK